MTTLSRFFQPIKRQALYGPPKFNLIPRIARANSTFTNKPPEPLLKADVLKSVINSPPTSSNSPSSVLVFDVSPFIPPEEFDMDFSDITEELVTNDIAKALDIVQYGQSTNVQRWLVHGIIWKRPNYRLFINLPVRSRSGDDINVIFLINTSSPYVYLSQSTLDTLGYDSSGCVTHINRVAIQTYLSPSKSHFANANILGAQFFSYARIYIKCGYVSEKVTLDREPDTW